MVKLSCATFTLLIVVLSALDAQITHACSTTKFRPYSSVLVYNPATYNAYSDAYLFSVDNNVIISEARIPGGFVSGYKTLTLPLIDRVNPAQTLCEGSYEVRAYIAYIQPGPSAKGVMSCTHTSTTRC